MKALSIKQPWASLIATGVKDIENRSWRTNYRGRIYIHASQRIAIVYPAIIPIKDPILLANILTRKEVTAAVIGEVDIVDCVKNHPSIWAEKDCWNWVLANPVFYGKPLQNIKGKLSFWDFKQDCNG